MSAITGLIVAARPAAQAAMLLRRSGRRAVPATSRGSHGTAEVVLRNPSDGHVPARGGGEDSLVGREQVGLDAFPECHGVERPVPAVVSLVARRDSCNA